MLQTPNESHQNLENDLRAARSIGYAPRWTYPTPILHDSLNFRCRDED